MKTLVLGFLTGDVVIHCFTSNDDDDDDTILTYINAEGLEWISRANFFLPPFISPFASLLLL